MDCPRCGDFNSRLSTHCACGAALRTPDSPENSGSEAAHLGATETSTPRKRKKEPQANELDLGAARVEAKRLLEENRTLGDVMERLEHRGLTAHEAKRTTLDAVGDIAVTKAQRTGFLWAAGGLAVTIGTCAMAGTSGSYFVFYGPVLWGIWRIITAENVRRQIG